MYEPRRRLDPAFLGVKLFPLPFRVRRKDAIESQPELEQLRSADLM